MRAVVLAGIVMVTLAAASWGTWSLFLRPTGLSPFVTTPIVFGLMAACTLPFALPGRATWARATIALLVANSIFDAANLVTFFGAMDTTTVAVAVLTHYLAPIIIAVAAPYFEGNRVAGTEGAAVVALAGLVIILEPWGTPVHGTLAGAALGTTSAVCYAGNVFCLRRLSQRIGAVKAMAYHSLIAAALVAPFAIAKLGTITRADGVRLAIGAATIGAGSGVVFALGLQRIGSARAAVLTFAEPLVAVAIGALVWREPLHPIAAVGGALVLGAGVYVARRARAAA